MPRLSYATRSYSFNTNPLKMFCEDLVKATSTETLNEFHKAIVFATTGGTSFNLSQASEEALPHWFFNALLDWNKTKLIGQGAHYWDSVYKDLLEWSIQEDLCKRTEYAESAVSHPC